MASPLWSSKGDSANMVENTPFDHCRKMRKMCQAPVLFVQPVNTSSVGSKFASSAPKLTLSTSREYPPVLYSG